jgi:FixJ family two-component response regulator
MLYPKRKETLVRSGRFEGDDCMCQLSRREREFLEKLMAVGDVALVAQDLGVKPATVYVVRARIRGKVEQARDFLGEMKKYKRALGHSQREGELY